MRSHLSWVFLALALVLPSATSSCGGGQSTTDGAKSPDPAAGSASPSVAGGPSAPPSDGAGPTTTVALGAGGDLQGAKLSETHTVASTSSSGAPAPSAAHGPDPGRGIPDIKAIVLAHHDEARACYDKAIPTHPDLPEGDLVIQWTIDPKGNVTQVSLDASRSKISEPTVVACVAGVLQKIQFAPSPRGFETKAAYPFNFRHHGPKP